MRSLAFRIIGVLCGFLVAFLLAEVAVRLISPQEVGPVRFACNPELGEIPVPGQQGERRIPGVYTFRYSNNSLGWRGRREYRGRSRPITGCSFWAILLPTGPASMTTRLLPSR